MEAECTDCGSRTSSVVPGKRADLADTGSWDFWIHVVEHSARSSAVCTKLRGVVTLGVRNRPVGALLVPLTRCVPFDAIACTDEVAL